MACPRCGGETTFEPEEEKTRCKECGVRITHDGIVLTDESGGEE